VLYHATPGLPQPKWHDDYMNRPQKKYAKT
jgi:hypothetical protein